MKEPFERVVQRHGATVLRVCRAVVGPDDADDVWSETFISALRAWPALPGDANVEAWLVTIAHRRGVDTLRARGRRATPMDPTDPANSAAHRRDPRTPSGVAPTAAADPAAAGDLDDLYAALTALPEKQRLAVAYHHLAGLPHAEVAALVGGTPAAARRASADGMAALRRHLGAG